MLKLQADLYLAFAKVIKTKTQLYSKLCFSIHLRFFPYGGVTLLLSLQNYKTQQKLWWCDSSSVSPELQNPTKMLKASVNPCVTFKTSFKHYHQVQKEFKSEIYKKQTKYQKHSRL